LQYYPLTGVTACSVTGPSDGRFWFNPIGIDAPLFNSPQPEIEITHLAEEINVPAPLRRRPLYVQLEARRQALAEGKTAGTLYFGPTPVLQVFVNGEPNAVKEEEILICDLSAWHIPDATKTYTLTDGTKIPLPIRVAVDPVLGRVTFPAAPSVNQVLVDYSYGFSGDMGGGPYDRSNAIRALRSLDGEQAFLDKVQWRAGVSQTLPAGGNIYSTLSSAVDAWNLQPANIVGAIAVLDSRTYVENLTGANHVEIPAGSQLLIYSADLPSGLALESAVPQNQRAHVRGKLSVKGTAGSTATPGELILNGLLIEGHVRVLNGNLGSLQLNHCTIAPVNGHLAVHSANDELVVSLERSICGKIKLPASVKQLQVNESIVDGLSKAAIHAPGARADLQASTFFGGVYAKMLEAGNSIFTKKATSKLRQTGCVRFCFLPEASVTPRRYRCQPDLALQDVTDAAVQAEIRLWLKPSFTSGDYGQPGYAQLKLTVPAEITSGADDGAEMGAFYFLKQPQREVNLRASLDEYLRFGLEAGIFYAT